MAAESAATVEPDDKAATAAVDAPRAPVSASGYEPPVPQADSNTAVETPADHPTSPAPAPENVPTPPGDLPDRIDTPAEPSHASDTAALGETHPGQSFVIGSLGPDDRPLEPLPLCDPRSEVNTTSLR